MKKLLFLLMLALLAFVNCSKSSDNSTPQTPDQEVKCNVKNGHQLFTGPQGGCYYYSSGGNKEYVDRSDCSCN